MKGRYRQWLMLLLALLVLIAVFFFNGSQMKLPGPPGAPAQSAPAKASSPARLSASENLTNSSVQEAANVSVVSVTAGSYRAKITAFGTVRPQYQLTLKSQLSGQVIALSPQFDSGLRLSQNTEMLRIDDAVYRAALASAKAEVAEARLQLLEAERQAIQAKIEWNAAGLQGEPDSELVLHQPQMTAAKATLAMAQANLSNARADLKKTKIVTPFDALVVERLVSPGSYVQQGTEIATLFSSQQMQIELPLSATDWLKMPDMETLTNTKYPVRLSSVEEHKSWQGAVLRLQQHQDETTRQRSIVVALDNPLDQSPPLFPGSFVEAQIDGREVGGLWKLPGSALSQRGEVWVVTEDNTLISFVLTPLFSDSHFIYVSVPAALASGTSQVVLTPLNGYMQGLRVNPVSKSVSSGAVDE